MPDHEKAIVMGSPHLEKETKLQQLAGSLPNTVIKHANDADEAMKAFAGYEGEFIVLDEATSKKLLKRIDLHLMPVSNIHPTSSMDIR